MRSRCCPRNCKWRCKEAPVTGAVDRQGRRCNGATPPVAASGRQARDGATSQETSWDDFFGRKKAMGVPRPIPLLGESAFFVPRGGAKRRNG